MPSSKLTTLGGLRLSASDLLEQVFQRAVREVSTNIWLRINFWRSLSQECEHLNPKPVDS
jgi:hypothetical protein